MTEQPITYNIAEMDVSELGLQRAINGGRRALLWAFAWDSTPQGFEYWNKQRNGDMPLDTAVLKEIMRQYKEPAK